MTILKSKHALLTREEFSTIKRLIKMMMTIKRGAEDPVLAHEAHTIALALEKFRTDFTIHASSDGKAMEEVKELEEWKKNALAQNIRAQVRDDETMSDYDRGFQDGMKWERDNPSIRPNY